MTLTGEVMLLLKMLVDLVSNVGQCPTYVASFHRFVADGYYEVDWGHGVVINDMGNYGE